MINKKELEDFKGYIYDVTKKLNHIKKSVELGEMSIEAGRNKVLHVLESRYRWYQEDIAEY